MIEFVNDARCTQCNLCVRICPANVFDAVPGAAPVIARKNDCLTCYVCELRCPVDALYVAPDNGLLTAADHELFKSQGIPDDRHQTAEWAGESRLRRAAGTLLRLVSSGNGFKRAIASGKAPQDIDRLGKSPRRSSHGG